MSDYISIRRVITAVLALVLLTACAAMGPAEKKANLASPAINNEAEAMGSNMPPVFNEGMMAEGNVGQSLGAESARKTVETTVLEGEPGYEEGIKIMGVGFLSAGYMLNFRYVVVDPEKSLPMFDRNVIPYLIHEKSGAKFAVPNPAKVGPLRAITKKPEKETRYYIMFANPGRYVKQGDLVTVVVGEHRFEHLAVQ